MRIRCPSTFELFEGPAVRFNWGRTPAQIREEWLEWLNNEGIFHTLTTYAYSGVIFFKNKTDAMRFKLVWG